MLWQLFSMFFKIGFFTIGGGYAMLPLIQKEVVEKKQWLSEQDFIDMLAITQSIPGIIAVNISVFLGYKIQKLKGAFVAALGCILPSFIIILIIAYFFIEYKDNEHIVNIFKGIRPAIVAMIAVAVWKMIRNIPFSIQTSIIIIIGTLLIWLCAISPIYIIIIAALWGIFHGVVTKNKSLS